MFFRLDSILVCSWLLIPYTDVSTSDELERSLFIDCFHLIPLSYNISIKYGFYNSVLGLACRLSCLGKLTCAGLV